MNNLARRRRENLKRATKWLIVASNALAVSACSKESPGPRGASADQVPETVAVQGGKFVAGTSRGALRKTYELESFRIARTPTTVQSYRQCVVSGACAAPSASTGDCVADAASTGATYTTSGNDDLAVTCVAAKQAEAFCAWAHGRLPTYAEWLLAARGTDARRYAWGDTEPTCDERADSSRDGVHETCPAAAALDGLRVGRHKAGASPFGVEDVLLTTAELLRADVNAQFGSCAAADAFCVATSVSPGSIDAFVPLDEGAAQRAYADAVPSFGFRCVFGEVSK